MKTSPRNASEPFPNSYDEVPYVSNPFAQSHPNRLATIARLFGIEPAPIERCRVLELGCSTGGNLIPMADQLPQSQFVGIDLSGVEIEGGRKITAALGLNNLRLEQKNILDVDRAFGEFDYIIAHGVYSWISDDLQDHLLRICKDNLAPNGVAYVSYNTYPGWRMRGMIRDMMCYRARRFDKPADRLRQSRALLDFLAQSVPSEDNAYGILLQDELEQIRRSQDHYLLHDYLEEVNEPVYFYEFVERSTAKGLQYLGEADYRVMSIKNFPPQVETMLQSVASDMVELEQYMDFLRNRMFRQTLLCQESIALDRSLSPERVLPLNVASAARPEGNVEIDIRSRDKVTYRGPSSVMTTSEPIVKAAMSHLAEIWPKSVPFSTLSAIAQSKLDREAVVVGTAHVSGDTRKLAEPLLRCYGTSLVELSVHCCPLTLEVSERPLASRVARHQATEGSTVTNARHERASLNEVQQKILPHLDGTNDVPSLVEQLAKEVAAGRLTVHDRGQRVEDAERLRQILGDALRESLAELARKSLLIG